MSKTEASSTEASSHGVSQPAAASAAAASLIAPRTVTPSVTAASGNRLLLQTTALLVVLERGGDVVELAHQHGIEVVHAQTDAVVGDALLREVVGADLLGALAGPDLGLTRGVDRRLLLGQRPVVQPRPQH